MAQNLAHESGSATDTCDAFLESRGSYSEKTLLHFLANLGEDANDKSARCNNDQKEIIGRVVHQIIQDEHYLSDRRRTKTQQFIRLLHGGPGTGKSHVIKILKEALFEQESNGQQGLIFRLPLSKQSMQII